MCGVHQTNAWRIGDQERFNSPWVCTINRGAREDQIASTDHQLVTVNILHSTNRFREAIPPRPCESRRRRLFPSPHPCGMAPQFLKQQVSMFLKKLTYEFLARCLASMNHRVTGFRSTVSTPWIRAGWHRSFLPCHCSWSSTSRKFEDTTDDTAAAPPGHTIPTTGYLELRFTGVIFRRLPRIAFLYNATWRVSTFASRSACAGVIKTRAVRMALSPMREKKSRMNSSGPAVHWIWFAYRPAATDTSVVASTFFGGLDPTVSCPLVFLGMSFSQ